MKLNYDKTKVITFTRKTNAIKYNYLLCDKFMARTDSIKDLGVLLDSKLLFHHHVDYVFSQSLKMLGIIRTMSFSFSPFDSFLLLYVTLVRSKSEYGSPVWNSIMATDGSKLEHLKLHTLQVRRHYLDALFFLQVILGIKFCPSLLDNSSLRIPFCNIRNFSQFSVVRKNCPSAGCKQLPIRRVATWIYLASKLDY
jgi:hypothetical protein